ncbi:MAG TPA: deoxyribonuclease IV [Frankiaceae bacterium]|nr:deoxyribonuclease IV [Frankiaceae bacterium]
MPARKPSPVGAHVPSAGGLIRTALPYAKRVGAQALQIFLGNPRGWAASAGDPAQDEAFAAECAASRLPVFVHAPYLINLGSPVPATLDRSIAALRRGLERSTAVGAAGLVLHAGSAVDPGSRDHALQQVREALLPLLTQLDEFPGSTRLLIEPTPGGAGTVALAASVEDLGPYFAALEHHPRLGVCLDTCHAYAAGHDLAAPGGARRTLSLLVKTVGRGRLGLVHANDSRDPLGSHRDRHAPIGVGTIGIEPFAEFFVHPATRGVPVVVETPGGEAQHTTDVRALKRLRDNAR